MRYVSRHFWRGSIRIWRWRAGLPHIRIPASLHMVVKVRGDPASAKFAVFHLKGDHIRAVEAVNAPPEFMMGKQLIGARRPVSREKLADATISMKEVAA